MINNNMRDLRDVSIVRVDTPEHKINYIWHDNADKIPNSVRFLTTGDIDAYRNEGVYSFPKGPIDVGAVLMKHPYKKDTFIFVEDSNTIDKDRWESIAHIAALLGATESHYILKNCTQTKRTLNVDGTIKYTGVKISAALKKEVEEQLKTVTKVDEKYAGILTNETYNQAKTYAKDHNLDTDTQVEKMIMLRMPGQKIYKEKTFTFKSDRLLSREIDAAFSLTILTQTGKFACNSHFNDSVTTTTEVEVEFYVKFRVD